MVTHQLNMKDEVKKMTPDSRIETLKRCCYDIAVEKSTSNPQRYAWDVDVRLEAMKTFAILVEAENGKQ